MAAFLPKHASGPSRERAIPPEAIVQLHARDDVDISGGWKRKVVKLAPLFTFLSSAAYVAYVTFRIYCVVSAQNISHKTYAPAWVFIAVELAAAIPSMIHNIWTMMAVKRRRRPKLRLAGEDVPTVDIFITCCGEEDDLVMDTVRAACDLDYPRDRCRVVLLDDGKSEGLEKACGQLAAVYGNVFYVSRPKFPGVPHHFKSGNLNYGLEAVTRFPGGASDYIAALDADMVGDLLSCSIKLTFIIQ